MRFTKMHGAGNDYIYVDGFADALPEDPAEVARQISDRHFGIGGDGLILIAPSDVADARMRMFNADGSEAQMCGNGIRCVAKYLFDHGLTNKRAIEVETAAGILALQLDVVDGLVERVRVDMGRPILAAEKIPTKLPGDPVVRVPLVIDGQTHEVTCVSMGNPHCIMFVDEPTDDWVHKVGPMIERDPQFPERVNASFVQVLSPGEVRMRVWERGSGETMACGTGACAVCVAGHLAGRTERKIVVHLPGGDLELEWGENDHVFMTGPAIEVFSGLWEPAKTAAAKR